MEMNRSFSVAIVMLATAISQWPKLYCTVPLLSTAVDPRSERGIAHLTGQCVPNVPLHRDFTWKVGNTDSSFRSFILALSHSRYASRQ